MLVEEKKQSEKTRQKYISIHGATLHNLKNVSVDIPHNRFTVITGVSGSGKSSLAFDTIYAEGQRRFVESLSAYARQFLERMAKPEVESITGIPPAIAIEQRPQSKNPRSTVGTTTEIYDFIRLLYGRIGTTICRCCGRVVKKDAPETAVNKTLELDEGDKLYILFPLPQQSRNLSDEMAKLKELGFFRIVADGSDEVIDVDNDDLPVDIAPDKVLVLADRLVLRKDKESVTRLTDSIEASFKNGQGRLIIRNLTRKEDYKFSSVYECPYCEILYMEPEPRLFSFNNPYGACPHCQGFGRTIGLDDDLIFPDLTRSLKRGAIHPFRTQGHGQHLRDLIKIAPKYKIDLDEPVKNLPREQMDIVWNGADGYIGITGFFNMLEENSYKMHYRVLISRYRGYTKCKHCGGSRLRTSARQVYVGDKNIPELVKMPVGEIYNFFARLELPDHLLAIAVEILKEIKWRLGLLVDIGLDYLTLDRLTHTLSGGESQRISLSTALGSSLVGTLYVLDEPSVGMHPRDTERLLRILYKLRNMGNTIVVVEHDPDIIRHADNIIDLGPHAGERGGEIMFSGTYEELFKSKDSLTAQYMTGRKKIKLPATRSKGNGNSITIYKPRENNLSMEKVSFPLGCMTVVTGVSGSGKSSLVHEVLYAGLKKTSSGYDGHIGSYEKIDGVLSVEHVELVDQSSIGKSSRSTPITYTKAFDGIRELFADTQAARQLGWKPGHFSFNVTGGRCDVCEGEGTVSVDMQFLPDVHLECEACKGTRYKKEARAILYKGKSIVNVLNMTIDEAVAFFDGTNKITKKLKVLQDVGLGYLRLGQPSTMLSGGESQRIKLASHLEASGESNGVFIFDEPTTGLHLDDISKLLDCFRRLIKKGNSVIIIEHNINVIASADWIIDLGPEAGIRGGKLVAAGSPEQIARVEKSYTGKALREFFARENDGH